MKDLIPLDKYATWKSEQLNVPVLRLTSHPRDYLSFGNLCEGVLALGQTGSGKSSALKTLANALMSQGYGWFGLTAKPGDVIDQLQWAFDADRIIYDEETGEVSGGVYILGSHPDDFTPYTITGKDGKPLELKIRDSQINFFEAEMSKPQSGQHGKYDPIERILNVVMTVAAATAVLQRKSGSGGGDDFWVRTSNMLLNSLLTIIYSATQQLDIGDIYKMLISLPKKPEDVTDGNSEWKNSYCAQFLKQHETRLQLQSATERNVKESISYCLSEFPAIAPQTGSSIVAVLGSVLDNLRRDPLYTLMCSKKTTVAPETIRQGNIFICGLSIKTHNELAQIAGILYKRTFQRVLERTLVGRGAVIWADEAQNFLTPDDCGFQETARSSRTIAIYITQNFPTLCKGMGGGDGGKQSAMALSGNLVNSLFFLNKDPETNNWAADIIGKDFRTIKNRGTSNTHMGGVSAGSSMSYNQQNEHILMPITFTRLKSGTTLNKLLVEAVFYRCGHRFSNGKPFLKAVFHQGHMGRMEKIERFLRRILGMDDYVHGA